MSLKDRKDFRLIMAGGFVLSCNAGFINAVGLASFVRMAVSHMSGQLTTFGIKLFHNSWDSLENLGYILAFIFGASIAGAVLGDQLFKFDRKYGLLLILESGLLFVSTGFFYYELWLGAAFTAVACGLQNGLCTAYSGGVLRTTHVTGIVTDIGLVWGHYVVGQRADSWKFKVLIPLFVGFFTGALIGSNCWAWFHGLSLLIPAITTGCAGVFYVVYSYGMELILPFTNAPTVASFGMVNPGQAANAVQAAATLAKGGFRVGANDVEEDEGFEQIGAGGGDASPPRHHRSYSRSISRNNSTNMLDPNPHPQHALHHLQQYHQHNQHYYPQSSAPPSPTRAGAAAAAAARSSSRPFADDDTHTARPRIHIDIDDVQSITAMTTAANARVTAATALHNTTAATDAHPPATQQQQQRGSSAPAAASMGPSSSSSPTEYRRFLLESPRLHAPVPISFDADHHSPHLTTTAHSTHTPAAAAAAARSTTRPPPSPAAHAPHATTTTTTPPHPLRPAPSRTPSPPLAATAPTTPATAPAAAATTEARTQGPPNTAGRSLFDSSLPSVPPGSSPLLDTGKP